MRRRRIVILIIKLMIVTMKILTIIRNSAINSSVGKSKSKSNDDSKETILNYTILYYTILYYKIYIYIYMCICIYTHRASSGAPGRPWRRAPFAYSYQIIINCSFSIIWIYLNLIYYQLNAYYQFNYWMIRYE